MSRMNFYLRLVAIWSLLVSALWATPSGYTSIYVFGDGVSTTTQNPPPLPTNLYNGGRFCDGSVWVEVLSQARGITYAPAKNISYYEHFSNLMVNSVNSLAPPADAATSLFIIWCANADFVGYVTQADIENWSLAQWNNAITQSVNNHVAAVNTLRLDKGAKVIMLPTAADIMKVPFFSDYSEKAFIRARIVDFNNQLTTAMNNLAAANPQLKIVMPDVFTFFDQVITNPAAYGMRNPSAQNVAIFTSDPWNQSRDFVFWDEEHPTAMFQAALSNFINAQVPALDTTPPVLTLPGNLLVEATGPAGAVVTFSTSALDAVSGSRPTTATPASGSTFPLGQTTVNVTATDEAGNTANGNFTVTVQDTTPPTLPTLTNRTREATGPSGAVVTFSLGNATDAVSGNRTCTATPPSGSTFPIGTTTVSVSASDLAGNPASGSFKVTVVNMRTLLQNVSITPGGVNSAAISGLIQGGAPGGQVILQASTDMGVSDPWQDISTITLDSNGNKSFGPIADPQGPGLSRDFFRIKLPLTP